MNVNERAENSHRETESGTDVPGSVLFAIGNSSEFSITK